MLLCELEPNPLKQMSSAKKKRKATSETTDAVPSPAKQARKYLSLVDVKEYIVDLYGELEDEEQAEILEFVQETMAKKAFQDNPQAFMVKWKEERGKTEEFCVGEDGAMVSLDRMIDDGHFKALEASSSSSSNPDTPIDAAVRAELKSWFCINMVHDGTLFALPIQDLVHALWAREMGAFDPLLGYLREEKKDVYMHLGELLRASDKKTPYVNPVDANKQAVAEGLEGASDEAKKLFEATFGSDMKLVCADGSNALADANRNKARAFANMTKDPKMLAALQSIMSGSKKGRKMLKKTKR